MDNNGHKTRFRDSSLHDEKCINCGATDARGDNRLNIKCPCAIEQETNEAENFQVVITKHTGIEEAHACIESTMGAEFVAKSTLKQIYSWEHSITRSQIFSIQLINIPTFVSVHLVRHVTTTPFVRSKRIDRDGDGTEDRFTPVNHRFIANAESILHIARKRLCYKASPETREVVLKIRDEMKKIDHDLAYYMVPNCVYRGGICPEPKPCGNYKIRRFMGIEDEEKMRII